MQSEVVPFSLGVTLFAMVILWFVLIKLLFSHLERVNPQKYEAMGRPSLFLRNNIATGWATFKFLLTREHRSLNDKYLSKLSDGMLIYFIVYLVLFFGISAWFAGHPVPAV